MVRSENDLDFLIAGRNNGEEKAYYPLFVHYVEEDHSTYCLIGNRSDKGPLIPQQPQIDHFFLIETEEERDDLDRIDDLRSIESVLAVFRIDPSTLPSVADLLVQ